MIVADTSAIVAVLFDEEDATDYLDKFAGVEDVVISAASYVELNAVLQRRLRAAATGLARRGSLPCLPNIELRRLILIRSGEGPRCAPSVQGG